MNIGGQTVENIESYEALYRKAKKNAKIYCIIVLLTILWEWWVYFQIDDIWIMSGAITGAIIRCLILIPLNFMWHKNLTEEYRYTSKGEKHPSVLRPWLAIIQTVIFVYSLLSWLASIAPCIIYVVDYGGYIYTISLICCIFGAVGYSGILYYLIKYFRYFRWTWEELQLPADIRYEQYRENRLKERQRKEAKRREARQKKAEAVKAKWQDFREAHFSGDKAEKPAPKTVKTQADRRAELENLKKLYEDGLIDEEEYRRAREKTLDI